MINDLLSSLTLRQRIWIGFGLLLLIFCVVSVNNVVRFRAMEKSIGVSINDIQPVMLAAQSLSAHLEASNSALGFYLLTKEDGHKASYLGELVAAQDALNQLNAMPYLRANEQFSTLLESIENDYANLVTYRDRMLELATSDTLNQPALQISNEKLNPAGRVILGQLETMRLSEAEESEGDRDTLRSAIRNLEFTYGKIQGELRAYLAFRGDVTVQNMETFIASFNEQFEILNSQDDLWTFEEEEAIPIMSETWEAYKNDLKELIAVHSSDRYRTDAWLVRTEIGPLLVNLQSALSQLIIKANDLTVSSGMELQSDASQSRFTVTVLLVFGLVFGVFIAFTITRMVLSPIARAVDAMEDLSQGEGDLTQRLPVRGKSEVTQMAVAFNTFSA